MKKFKCRGNFLLPQKKGIGVSLPQKLQGLYDSQIETQNPYGACLNITKLGFIYF